MGNQRYIKTILFTLTFTAIFSSLVLAQNKKLEEAKHLFTDVRAHNVAKKLLDEVISENPSEEEAYYYRGQLHYDLMNYHVAREDFTKAIEIDSRYSDHYYQRGLVLLKMKDYKGAIQDFGKAINLRKGGSDTYYVARAEAYRLSQKYDKAIKDCDNAMMLNPNNGIARSIRGLIEWNLGKNSSASSFFTAATISNVKKEEKALIHYYYAIYCEGIGQYEKALNNYTAAINLNKIPVEYYYGKANLELKLQNYKEAKETADIVIRKHKRLTETYVTRAICNYKENTNEEYERDILYFFKWAKYNEMPNAESYIAEHFYKYLVKNSTKQDEVLLKRLDNWMEIAIEKQNSAKNSILYAQILFKSGNNSKIQNLVTNIDKITDINPEEKNEFDKILAEVNNVTTDKILPKISITTPTFEAKRGVIVVEATKKMIVKGLAEDKSGIKRVSIGGNPARLEATGRFSGEVFLKKGDNLITVVAEDFAGNVQSKPFVIRKEETVVNNQPTPKKEKVDFTKLGTHRALLFATDEYDEWGRLMNPINDAETIARDLERLYGFETEVVRNPTGRKIIEKLREYNTKDYGSDDELFIFFAGHGQYDEMLSEGYIVAKDSKLQEISKLSYVPHSTIRTYTNSIPCEHIFLVMDVCFGGTFDPLVAARGTETDVPASTIAFVNRLLFYKTRKYFTSGGKEYVSDGVAGKHSPFVRIFLEALRKGGGNDGILTADEIVLFFEKASPKPQYGQFGANEPGSSFVFVPRY